MVGRDTELAVLHQRLETALQGQRQVVFLAGEPGIGKTALVDAFLAQLQERTDVRVASGQCVEQYGPGEAYLPLLEAITRLCRAPGGEQRVEALQRYAPSWLAPLADQRLRELQTELEEVRTFHDLGRAEKLQQELDFLTRELSSAVGLGGRSRKTASISERARVNVSKRTPIR